MPVNAKLGAGGFIGGKFYIVSSGGKMAIYGVAKNSWSSGPARPGYQCPATAFATLP